MPVIFGADRTKNKETCPGKIRQIIDNQQHFFIFRGRSNIISTEARNLWIIIKNYYLCRNYGQIPAGQAAPQYRNKLNRIDYEP